MTPQKKTKRPKNHTPGIVRYFTYWLEFPDGETWVDQSPFVHDLQFQLRNTAFRKEPAKYMDILSKGETKWKDGNGVKHYVVIEETKRNKVWGTRKNR